MIMSEIFRRRDVTVLHATHYLGCDHCKNLEPEFDAAAHALDEEGVVLAKMNIDNKGNRAVGKQQ